MGLYNPLLDTFLAVYESRSFNKASEVVHVTPAAVMNQINQLEYQLSLQLFTRTKRGLIPTREGDVIFKQAKRAIRDSEKAVEKAKEASKVIRIGSSFLNPCNAFLEYWKRENPDSGYSFKIVPYSDDRKQILELVKSLGEEIDILYGAFNSAEMQKSADYLILGEYELAIAVPSRHPLFSKELLKLEDLSGERVIVPRQEEENGFKAFMEAHPEILFEEADCYYDLDNFNYCEEQNCLLLTLTAWKEVHPSLKTIPLDWNLTVPYGLLYPKEHNSSLAEFLKLLEKD